MDTASECLHSFPPFIYSVNVGIPVFFQLLRVLHVPFDDLTNCLEEEGHPEAPSAPSSGCKFCSLLAGTVYVVQPGCALL